MPAFLLDLSSGKGRGGGNPDDPWTHLQNRIGIFAQDDFKATDRLSLNLGLRWAYTSPLVEVDNRQTNFDLVTGRQIVATDGSIEDRALYTPYYKGFEPRLGAAWTFADKWVARGGYGISQFMEGTGANLRLPLNPPFFFESAVSYDVTTGAGNGASGFADLVPGTTPSGNVRAYDPNLRPQFTQQWNAFLERELTPDHVRTGRLRGAPCRSAGDAGRGQPGVARHRRSIDVGAKGHSPAALQRAAADHHHRDDGRARREPVQLDAGQRAPAHPPRNGAAGVVHVGERHHQQPRLLRRVRRHGAAGRDRRDRRGVLAEHIRSRRGMGTGLSRRATQSDRVGHRGASVREGPQVRRQLARRGRRDPGRLGARRDFSDALRAAGDGHRRPAAIVARRAGL